MTRTGVPASRTWATVVREWVLPILCGVLAFFAVSELWERLVSPAGADTAGRFALFFTLFLAMMHGGSFAIQRPATRAGQILLALAMAAGVTALRWAVFG